MNFQSTSFPIFTLCLITIATFSVGCAESNPEPSVSYNGSKFILSTEPASGQNVISARENSTDDQQIVVIGRIGGSVDPWVDGRAAFSIVDPSILACSDEKEDGEVCSCKTPWDYCCETDKLPNATALVTFVENDGSVVKHDARQIFDIKELETVVIQGMAKRDDSGNLTILASGMYVKR